MSHCDTTQDMVTVRSWRTLLVAERIVDRALGFGGWVLLQKAKAGKNCSDRRVIFGGLLEPSEKDTKF